MATGDDDDEIANDFDGDDNGGDASGDDDNGHITSNRGPSSQ